MRGFEYLWNCAVCLRPAQCGLSLEEQFRDTDSLFQFTFYDPTEKVYWLRCPYCRHSFHKECATNLRLGELEYYGWACCREVDYTVFRGGVIPNRDVLGYIHVNFSVYFSVIFSLACLCCLHYTTTGSISISDCFNVQPSFNVMNLILFGLLWLLWVLVCSTRVVLAVTPKRKREEDDDSSGKNFSV